MTHKGINWQCHIRKSLRDSDDVEQTLQELLNKFSAVDLQNAIIDMYINIKEKKLGTHKEQSKNNYYIQFSNEARQNKYDVAVFHELKNKYIDEYM